MSRLLSRPLRHVLSTPAAPTLDPEPESSDAKTGSGSGDRVAPATMTCVVAVVDDDPRVLESLENLLESGGYAVRLFSSAPSLLQEADLAEIDCLITDIDMPIMNGLELRQVVHETRPDLPVILITGRGMTDEALASAAGSHGFFRKPFNGLQLLTAVGYAFRSSGRGTQQVHGEHGSE
jgi:FixJ family two-component response regulator